MKRVLLAIFCAGALPGVAEDFESVKWGGFTLLESAVGTWSAAKGEVEIHKDHARSGKQSLRLKGGEKNEVKLALKGAAKEKMMLSFWVERWTRNGPFKFWVEELRGTEWEEIYDGTKEVRVGGFLTKVEVPISRGVKTLRFGSTTPPKSGVILDDLTVDKVKPMMVTLVTTLQPVVPVLIRKKDNSVLLLQVVAEGRSAAKKLTVVKVDLRGTTELAAVKAVRVLTAKGEVFGEGRKVGDEWICKGASVLEAGKNDFQVSIEVSEKASLDGRVDARVLEVEFDDDPAMTPEVTSPDGSQRIGYGLRLHGDDRSKGFRIPGLATTKKGSLIAVYDVRYRSGGDLPGDIDVGMSRSADGGQTWDAMKIIMDMGDDPKWRYDGVGDPAVLVDQANGRVWVVGTWSHGNRSWHGSGQGLTAEETGQLMMVHSDDDGLTWSKPINITKQVKKPEWHFLLQGPGAGITMKNGTIVFAAQYQDSDKYANGRKKGTPFSSILYSKDHGKTWQVGTGIKSNTTEAQVVELADGSLMLNCRDNRGGSRTVGVTTDMGKTWTMHPTDRKGLPEPVCMASLLRMGDRLIFSNPNTRGGRHHMTIKVSDDDGMSWPEGQHTLYDSRLLNGYSCLAPIGEDQVGVLYEGRTEIFFLRFSLEELAK